MQGEVDTHTKSIILVKSNPLDVVSIIELSRVTYKKMIQNLIWATGYNAFAIPVAAGIFHAVGFVLSPAIAAIFMALSTILCAVNAKLLYLKTRG